MAASPALLALRWLPSLWQGWPPGRALGQIAGCLQEPGLGFWPRTGPAEQKLRVGSCAGKIFSLVLRRLQLVESLDDHAVEFLELVYVPPLSSQSSRHVVHLASGLNFEMENRVLQGSQGPELALG